MSVKLNGDNGEYWKAIADPKPPEPLSEVIPNYIDALSRIGDRITRQKCKRRILDTPYPPRGEIFVDWCPVPKRVTRVTDEWRSTVPIITGMVSVNGEFDQLLHADVPLKRINWNDPDRGTLHHRYYGWEPKTKTLVLGPERIEACEHHDSRVRSEAICRVCGFDLANARRWKPYNMNARVTKDQIKDIPPITLSASDKNIFDRHRMLMDLINSGLIGDAQFNQPMKNARPSSAASIRALSEASRNAIHGAQFKQWREFGMYPTAAESDPIEKTSKADPLMCDHKWRHCEDSDIAYCEKCHIEPEYLRRMQRDRRNARKPRRGLLWRMRAIWDRWGWRYEECRTLFGSTPIHRYSLLRYLSFFHFPYTGEGSPLAGFGVFVSPFRIDFARWSLYFGRKTVGDRAFVEKLYGAAIYHIPFQRILPSVFLAIHYGHVNSPIGRDVKRQVFDLYLCGGETYGCHSLTRIIRRYTLRPIASAARWLWSLVPKPVPGKRWRSGWKHLSEEERETLFREFK